MRPLDQDNAMPLRGQCTRQRYTCLTAADDDCLDFELGYAAPPRQCMCRTLKEGDGRRGA
jgi:hypothetical protein